MQGLLCAVVEDNLDPKKIGRVKIRIPSIHGSNPSSRNYTSTEDLDWAYPSMPFFSAYDCGSFIVPPVGSYIWVMEAAGTPSYYVYLGGVPGSGPKMPKPMNCLDPENPNSVSMGQYYTPIGENEMPVDLQSTEYAQSGVIFKSQKGHTIKYNDQDGAESFEIIDRSGQSIVFECPVSVDENKSNAARRGASKTHDGGRLRIKSSGATITLGNNSVTINSGSIKLISSKTSLEI